MRQKPATRKKSTYYVPFVSFVSKSACDQNPAMNPAMTPAQNQPSRHFFLPNYQGILVRPMGVMGFGVLWHLVPNYYVKCKKR